LSVGAGFPHQLDGFVID